MNLKWNNDEIFNWHLLNNEITRILFYMKLQKSIFLTWQNNRGIITNEMLFHKREISTHIECENIKRILMNKYVD